jgi:DNA mismatch repair protein MutS
MIEFKTILSQADKNSLVLGDELCSGTENNSAISIFVAGLDHLYKQNTKFIFATHFHEIARFEEIVMKNRLLLKHLAVHYDQEQDKLVYDRKLQDGPGESMYGLEVCKALKLPQHFLSAAHEIRNKYCKETSSMLDYKPSRYNAKKLRGICERCNKNFSTEVHHINHQKEANKDGFIGHFHKNHVANLASLCEECHLAEHQNENHHI